MSEESSKVAIPRKKSGGRVKGTPNRRTLDAVAQLEASGCKPLEALLRIAEQAESSGDLALAGSMYKELAQYVAPKRKAVEVTGDGGGAIEQSISVSVRVV